MTATEDAQQSARARLITAMKKLGVFSRIDDGGCILAFDGKQEYEVIVDLNRLLSKRVDGYQSRRIVVGTSSLLRLERGDVKELFPDGIMLPARASGDQSKMALNYLPLEWASDPDCLDVDDALAAQGDDWTYRICPIHGDGGDVLGYRVSGGDTESGDEFGSSMVGGEIGELTLAEAKAVAESDYAARYLEAEGLLEGLVERDEHDRFVSQVDEPGLDKVEVVATLRDEGDYYDGSGRVTVCLRTILGCNGDRDALLDELRRIIRYGA